jgi:hypothetical protein
VKHEEPTPKSPQVKVFFELCFFLRNKALHTSPLAVVETFFLFSRDIRQFIPFKHIWRGHPGGAKLLGADLRGVDLSGAKVKSDSPDKADLASFYKKKICDLKNDFEHIELNGAPSLLPIFNIYKEFTNYISEREQRQGLSSKFFQPGVTCNDQKLSFILQVGEILLKPVKSSQPRVDLQNKIQKLTLLDSRARAVSDILRPRRLGNTEFSLSNRFQGLLENIRTKSDEHQSSQDNQLIESERQHDVEPPQP